MNNEPSRPEQTPPKKRHVISRLVALFVVIALGAGVFLYGSQIYDWARVSKFAPTAQLASTSNRIEFTDRGQQIFYATFPSIEDKASFNTSCASTERTVAILGCYTADRIYLYNIQNAELDGTLEVTAAHEMLHAAYHRLNYFERQTVDMLIEQEYAKIKDQAEIKQVMQYYQQAEPGAELDELHSIIGTTISDLPPELEQYYARYFTDRSAVVALNEKYNAVFSELSQQADVLQQQIDSEGPAIKIDLATYDIDLAQLNLDIQSFNQRANSGAFRTQSEFNTARNALEARISALNQQRQAINARVDAYNAAVDELNKLAVHVNKLNESINGADAPSEV